ncbi:MAG TPA: TrkA family potassium uptake protein [Erysipelotrichaceae bacterium]|jgi:trk system potassium uptake protein TrkA|nr:TrkA family potassium uptake protein [Erysipelotrichaceae bacterium]HQB31737.1 TrkA family potassium uptake protein [Erysipelotrichaceae bacterium]
MFGKKKKNKVTYGIVGLGRFGQALTEELAASGSELIVLDNDDEKIRDISELTENAYVVKTLDKKSLQETGIQNCDIAIVCIGEHMDMSILTTLNLISIGIPRVIAKATSLEHGIILEKLGADVVYPERDMAIRLASRLETARELDIIQLSEKINITKMQVPEQIIEKTVEEISLRVRFGLNIIAVENDGQVLENISPNYVFKHNDVLFLAGSKEGLTKFNHWAASDK